MKLKKYLINKKNAYQYRKMRAALKNHNFTIISNNCWGGRVSQDLNVEYNSPFVGLFLYAPCYIEMLKSLEANLNFELKFKEISKYEDANEYRNTEYYPIGTIGNDIEIHFLHYKDEDEAKQKWSRRLKRINWDNLFVKFCDRDLCEEKHIFEFDNLNFRNKVVFTAKKYEQVKSHICFEEFLGRQSVENELEIYNKYFDVVAWLNTGNIILKK